MPKSILHIPKLAPSCLPYAIISQTMAIKNKDNLKTNQTKKLPHATILLCLIAVVSITSLTPNFIINTPAVYADEFDLNSVTHKKLNNTEKGNISTGCASIQTSLKNLQKNDSKARVLLGTSYQALLTNFLSPLNVRLVKNNLPDTNLTRIQSEMFASRNNFVNLFVTYSQHLETLISLDCKNQPDSFYYELENVRFLRDKLEESVTQTNSSITAHLQAVDQLKHNLNNLKINSDQKSGVEK